MSGPAAERARFVRRLGAVPEPAMRLALWRERFESAEPVELLALVREVLEGLARRSTDHVLAYLALAHHLEAHRGRAYPPRQALHEVALAAQDQDVLAMLRTPPPARAADPDAIRPPNLSDDREITLGERRSFARRPDRKLLTRLLYDPDPQVVTNLLQNPRLTEADVLRIASRRPMPGEVLALVFAHPRWGRRTAVQRALVYNPYTPAGVALAMVTMLELADLRTAVDDPALPEAVRARARAHLSTRASLPPEPEPEDQSVELDEDLGDWDGDAGE